MSKLSDRRLVGQTPSKPSDDWRNTSNQRKNFVPPKPWSCASSPPGLAYEGRASVSQPAAAITESGASFDLRDLITTSRSTLFADVAATHKYTPASVPSSVHAVPSANVWSLGLLKVSVPVLCASCAQESVE